MQPAPSLLHTDAARCPATVACRQVQARVAALRAESAASNGNGSPEEEHEHERQLQQKHALAAELQHRLRLAGVEESTIAQLCSDAAAHSAVAGGQAAAAQQQQQQPDGGVAGEVAGSTQGLRGQAERAFGLQAPLSWARWGGRLHGARVLHVGVAPPGDTCRAIAPPAVFALVVPCRPAESTLAGRWGPAEQLPAANDCHLSSACSHSATARSTGCQAWRT